MNILLNYTVKTGKYDNNDDVHEYKLDNLGESIERAYRRAVMTGTDLEDVPELQSLCDDARSEIEKSVLRELVESGEDYFALECLGETKMDLDELNALVHAKDPHAIQYFGLSGLSDSDLKLWDAAEQENIPLVKDFKDGFTPRNPFENGYEISVFFPEDEIIPDDEDTEAFLREALSAHDVDLAEEVILEQQNNYSGNLLKKSFEIAAEVGCHEFIDKNCQ